MKNPFTAEALCDSS